MQPADMEMIKEIPGFRVILKTVLRTQIQSLVQQLSEHTGEESVLLTASVTDGTLSHLGSESGKVFLEGHEDIKSQFLGFCLKRYHRQKQLEKVKEIRAFSDPGSRLRNPELVRNRSSRTSSHSPQSQTHVVHHYPSDNGKAIPPTYSHPPSSLSKGSPRGVTSSVRYSPYSSNSSLNKSVTDQDSSFKLHPELTDKNIPSSIVKTEVEDDCPEKSEVEAGEPVVKQEVYAYEITTFATSMDTNEKIEASDNEDTDSSDEELPESATDDGRGEATCAITHQPAHETKSSVEYTIPIATLAQPQHAEADTGANPDIKSEPEAVTDADIKLEITRVEPGFMFLTPTDIDWTPGETNTTLGASLSGSNSEGDMADEKFDPSYVPGMNFELADEQASDKQKLCVPSSCDLCNKTFQTRWHLERHKLIHSGERAHPCNICGKRFALKHNLKTHLTTHEHKNKPKGTSGNAVGIP